MCIFKKKKICVTHDGSFHVDDIFATAVLSILNNGNIKVFRSRDSKIISKADYVYDVGGIYNPDENKFDHHQKGRPERENGIPYSSFGLVWRKYGEVICGSKDVASKIDSKIVIPVDARDNGVDFIKPIFKNVFPYAVDSIFLSEYPTWKECESNLYKIFIKQVKKATVLLRREIKIAKDDVEGEKILSKEYSKAEDKRLIILDINMPRYIYQNFFCRCNEPLYVVLPSKNKSNWKIEAVRVNEDVMESRKPFPMEWRGVLDKDELRKISGISDIEFCHNSGFLCETVSKEGAMRLAEKALLG